MFFKLILFIMVARVSIAVRVDSMGVMGKDAQSITLEWSLPSIIDAEWIGFKIKYSTDNLVYTPILLKNINLRKFRIDNLKPDTEYKIQISAVNKNDFEGPATDFVIVKTLDAVPGEPQDFKVVQVTSRTIELEWKAPRRDEQSSSNNIKGYEIHYYKVNAAGTGPSAQFTDPKDTQVFKRKTNNVKKLKYTLTDLEPNSQYQIQIFAYNMKGDGQRSSPLMVTTLDEGPGKPENIRSEIYNDQLNIRWQAPAVKSKYVTSYVIHFNNERYEVNGQTNQISFPNSKWEYDRQYEFRIYAKASGDNVPNGAEAVFRISTLIMLFAVPNTTSIIRQGTLDSFIFITKPYFTRKKPNRPKFNNFSNQKNFISLSDSAYLVHRIINQNKLNIQLEKLTSRSVLIKWNSVTLSKESPTYYKLEYSLKSDPNNVVSHDHLTDNELQLYNLRANSDYVVQLIAISLNNADLFSEPCIKHFRTLLTDIDPPLNLQVIRFEPDKISIKWELANRHPNYKLFRVYFKELNAIGNYGDLNYEAESGSNDEWRAFDQPLDQTELILEDLNEERDYAVKVLVVDQTDYEGPDTPVRVAYRLKKISQQQQQKENHVIDYSKQDTAGSNQPRQVEILEFTSTSVKFAWMPPEPSNDFKIDKFLISYVDRPKIYRESNGSLVTYHKGIVLSIRAPARDDPSIRITWLVNGLTPYTDYDFNISSILANSIPSQPVKKHVRTRVDKPMRVDSPKILQIYDDNTVRFENGNASQFHGPVLKYWFVVVPLGYELQHDKYIDDIHQQDKDINFLLRYSLMNQTLSNESAYIAAEFESRHWPNEFIVGDGNKFGRFKNRPLIKGYDYRAYVVAFSDDSSGTNRANMLGLGEIFAPSQHASAVLSMDADLFARSPLSALFNTRYALNSQYTSVKMVDYESIVWIGTALLLFALILLLISVAAFNLRKKRRTKLIDNVAANSATSSTITANTKHPAHMDTQVLMSNITGSYTVNSVKQQQQQQQSDSRSSSSSSTTTISPTTALLSCSINNTTSQSIHNQNIHSACNGLLTTASHPINNTNVSAQIDNLYTSIEVTQKLLQQDFMNTFTGSSSNGINGNNGNHVTGLISSMGTINRANGNHQLGLINQYDPIEYRRAHYPTQSLLANRPIQLESLAHHIETLKMDNNCKFSQEYESIEPGEQFTWQHSSHDLNRLKNRYANVVAYDHSRVVLSRLSSSHFNSNNANQTISVSVNFGEISPSSLPPPPPLPPGSTQSNPVLQSNCSDYINANYIDGCRKKNAYIATQGPLPSTIGDFWRMIWEQQTSTIVMMTKLEERNRLKCDQYWPNKGSQVYDNCVQVTLVDQTELCSYTVRTFVLAPVGPYAHSQMSSNSSNIEYETRRELKHFQFTAWPDHGVPEHPTQFIQFVRRVRNSSPIETGPVVVHCSAGVGRTGCFIVVDSMLERIGRQIQDKTIDIYGYVTCMRAQRNYMVQTEEQYVFCYETILEAYQSGLHTEVSSRNLYQHLQRLLQVSSDGSNAASMLTEMELEYKRLSSIRAPQSKFHSANLPSNKFKNRLCNILPYESTRVVLQTLNSLDNSSSSSSGTDYINASFIDGYKYKRAYIATQAPLVETIDDFWRMLWEHNSTIVVMLTKLREMGREKCAQYWPNERSIRYQYFVVDPIAEYNMSQYILREFKVTDARDGQSRTIRQFQFVDWPEQGVPKSGESIIELIGQVHKTKEQFGQTGPITVHCSAGVGRTGVFITLSIVLERMRFEGLVDVFNTVKILRTQRSAMVQTEDQYQFCYRAALEYLGSFDGYE